MTGCDDTDSTSRDFTVDNASRPWDARDDAGYEHLALPDDEDEETLALAEATPGARVSYTGTLDPSFVASRHWEAVKAAVVALLAGQGVHVDLSRVPRYAGLRIDRGSITVRTVRQDDGGHVVFAPHGPDGPDYARAGVVTDEHTYPLPEGHTGWIEVTA